MRKSDSHLKGDCHFIIAEASGDFHANFSTELS